MTSLLQDAGVGCYGSDSHASLTKQVQILDLATDLPQRPRNPRHPKRLQRSYSLRAHPNYQRCPCLMHVNKYWIWSGVPLQDPAGFPCTASKLYSLMKNAIDLLKVPMVDQPIPALATSAVIPSPGEGSQGSTQKRLQGIFPSPQKQPTQSWLEPSWHGWRI